MRQAWPNTFRPSSLSIRFGSGQLVRNRADNFRRNGLSCWLRVRKPWVTVPSDDERSAACTNHASDELDQVGNDRQQMDSLIAELEALLEEARQLPTRYLLRKQEPDTLR
jgi:hypothetical protein